MSVRSGQSITVDFTTLNASAVLTNADSTPTGTLVVNGTDNGASVTITNKSAGNYKAAVTLPTLAVNDIVQLRINATIGGSATASYVWEETKDLFAGAIPDILAGASGGLSIYDSVTPALTIAQLNSRTLPSGDYANLTNQNTIITNITNTPSGVWYYALRTLTAPTNLSIPTVQQIEAYLSTTHGSGVWDALVTAADNWAYADRTLTSGSFNGPTLAELQARTLPSGDYGNIVNQNTLLSRLTSQRATNLDYLDSSIAAVPSGNWSYPTRILTAPTNLSIPTVQQIEAYLAGIHGSGIWDALASAADIWAYNNRTLTSGSFNGPTLLQFNDRTLPSGEYAEQQLVLTLPTENKLIRLLAALARDDGNSFYDLATERSEINGNFGTGPGSWDQDSSFRGLRGKLDGLNNLSVSDIENSVILNYISDNTDTILTDLGSITIDLTPILIAISGVPGDVWSYDNRILTSGTNIILEKGVGLVGLNDLSTGDIDSNATMLYLAEKASMTLDNTITIIDDLSSLTVDLTPVLTAISGVSADVWSYNNRILTSGTNISLTKGIGLLGLNDISVSDINSNTVLTYISARVTSADDTISIVYDNTLDILTDLDSIQSALVSIGTASGTTPAEIWSYEDRRLTTGSGIGFPTVEQIDTQLSLTHGSGPWGGSNQGTNIIDLYTKTDTNVVIGSVAVEVRASGTNALLAILRSHSLTGKATFNLDSGQYAVYAYKSESATFRNPYYIDVTTDESFILNGILMTIPVPSTADSSNIYAYTIDLGLGVEEGVEMYITPSGEPTTFAERSLLIKPITALSNDFGLVSIDVAVSTAVRVRIPKTNLDKYVMSPASGSLNIATA